MLHDIELAIKYRSTCSLQNLNDLEKFMTHLPGVLCEVANMMA